MDLYIQHLSTNHMERRLMKMNRKYCKTLTLQHLYLSPIHST